MTVLDTIRTLEAAFWDASSRADGDFYRTRCTEDALFVFFFGLWTANSARK